MSRDCFSRVTPPLTGFPRLSLQPLSPLKSPATPAPQPATCTSDVTGSQHSLQTGTAHHLDLVSTNVSTVRKEHTYICHVYSATVQEGGESALCSGMCQYDHHWGCQSLSAAIVRPTLVLTFLVLTCVSQTPAKLRIWEVYVSSLLCGLLVRIENRLAGLVVRIPLAPGFFRGRVMPVT